MDRWGLALSGLCLVHCLATPILILSFPFFATFSSSVHHLIHIGLALALVPIAVRAVTQGYLHHRKRIVPLFAGSGAVFVSTGALAPLFQSEPHVHHEVTNAFYFPTEIWFTITGSVLLLVCHTLNIYYCRPKKLATPHAHSCQNG